LPVALTRLTFDGSVPSVMLTVMPGFNSRRHRPRWPFALISVNCVMARVLVVFASVTVIELALTLEIVGA
jgi:hypothetical protein